MDDDRDPRLDGTGKEAFYEGEIAKWIEEDSLTNGGLITLDDLTDYEAKERTPISIDYRGYEIVSMAPVASGGLVLLQIMSILENFDLKAFGPNSAETVHLGRTHGFFKEDINFYLMLNFEPYSCTWRI